MVAFSAVGVHVALGPFGNHACIAADAPSPLSEEYTYSRRGGGRERERERASRAIAYVHFKFVIQGASSPAGRGPSATTCLVVGRSTAGSIQVEGGEDE